MSGDRSIPGVGSSDEKQKDAISRESSERTTVQGSIDESLSFPHPYEYSQSDRLDNSVIVHSHEPAEREEKQQVVHIHEEKVYRTEAAAKNYYDQVLKHQKTLTTKDLENSQNAIIQKVSGKKLNGTPWVVRAQNSHKAIFRDLAGKVTIENTTYLSKEDGYISELYEKQIETDILTPFFYLKKAKLIF